MKDLFGELPPPANSSQSADVLRKVAAEYGKMIASPHDAGTEHHKYVCEILNTRLMQAAWDYAVEVTRAGVTGPEAILMAREHPQRRHAEGERQWFVTTSRVHPQNYDWRPNLDTSYITRGPVPSCAAAVGIAKAWIAEGRRSPLYLVLAHRQRYAKGHSNTYVLNCVKFKTEDSDEVPA